MLPLIFSSFILPFGLAVVLTPAVRLIAIRRQWVAHPKEDRWHKTTTALMGGIAIFLAMAGPVFFSSDFASVFNYIVKADNTSGPVSLPAVLFIGSTFLFLLGLFDDFRSIKPHSKLIGQILAASLVTFLGFRLHWFESMTLDTMATIFWIVGITNAFNLIDNMDGLCAGVGAVAAFSLAVLYKGTSVEAFQVSLALAGALTGFLIYNFNPAKIFMGDCGSLVIGFGISVTALVFGRTAPANHLATVAVPILLLLVPILDTSLVTIIRILSGRKASTGGRDHTSHRLVLMGLSERKSVLYLYLIGAISGLSAIYVSASDTLSSPAVIIPVAVAFVLMGVYLSQLRVYPDKEFSRLRGRSFTPVLLELTYKRHMVLVMLDFILISFAYYLSYRLRFDGLEFSYYFQIFLKSLPVIIGCKIIVFFVMGIYRGLWSFISTSDVFLYLRASLLASLVSIAAVTIIYRFQDFSKGLFIIDCVLTTGLMLGVRGSFRLFLETQKRKTLSGDKVLIYGAGRGGELLLREILNNGDLKVNPVGFVDDDTLKHGKKIQGYAILGAFDELDQIHEKHDLKGIIVSFNESQSQYKETHESIKSFCRQHDLWLKQFTIDLKDVSPLEGGHL
jgi:UDP-GlcNAc:undecaprenyl-phosphate/decaprenyl-phosphate GlcNAc-1-phosphate transferase